jgi:putative oxidoreductase
LALEITTARRPAQDLRGHSWAHFRYQRRLALARIGQGKLSNEKGIGAGVLEYRIDFGKGYRVYFRRDGDSLVILLAWRHQATTTARHCDGAPPVRPSSSVRQGQRKEETMIDRRTAPFAALILRLTLSFLFSAHLYRKYAFTGYEAWFNGWVQAGYPAWTLYYTVAVEFAGASLLLLGVYTRYVALFALPVIIAVAQLWATRRGFWFSDGGVEFPLAWTAMLIAQALLGDGAFALKTPVLPWERSARLPA